MTEQRRFVRDEATDRVQTAVAGPAMGVDLGDRRQQADRSVQQAVNGFQSLLGRKRKVANAGSTDSSAQAALLAIARAFGNRTASLPAPGNDEALHDYVMRAAAAIGLVVRKVTLPDRWWRQDIGPFLAIRPGAASDGKTAVHAVLPRWRGGYCLADPDTVGHRSPLTKDFRNGLGPEVYAFSPALPDGPLTLRRVLTYAISSSTRDIAELVATALLGGLLTLALPLAAAFIVESVIPEGDRSLLFMVAAIVVVAMLVSFLTRFTGEIANLRIDGRVGNHLQVAIADRILRVPQQALRRMPASALTMQAMLVERFRKAIFRIISATLLAILFSVSSLTVLIWFAPMAAVVVLALVVAVVLLSGLLGVLQFRAMFEGDKIEMSLSGVVFDIVSNITVIKSFAVERFVFAHWAENYARFRERLKRRGTYRFLSRALDGGFEILIIGAGFGAVSMLHGGSVGEGAMIAFVGALTTVVGAGVQLNRAVRSLADAAPMGRMIRPLLALSPAASEAGKPAPAISGAVEVLNATFRYHPDGPPVIDGVSITAQPGEFVALVGPSGSGKSTLLRLVLGLDPPETGAIYYDNVDLGHLNATGIRRQIGSVLQSERLFPGTLFDNIRGPQDITLNDAWEAARLAAIANEIEQLPMGMHTVVNEAQSTISGGQAQRILLARALAAHPRLLLIDEGTSALDERTQLRVSTALAGLEVTRIVIAHRLSTVRSCDRVYVLDQGRVVQSGTFEELAEQPGLFRDLLRRGGA